MKNRVKHSIIHKLKDNHYHLTCQPYEDHGYYLFTLKGNKLAYFTEINVGIYF